MKALSDLWNEKIIRCPYANLICQYSYKTGALNHLTQCIAKKTFQTCERIQEEVVGKRPKDAR